MPGSVSVPVTWPSGLVARRRDRQDRGRRQGRPAGCPRRSMRSHGRPSVRWVAAPYSFGATPNSSTLGRYESAVSRYGSPSPTTRTRRVRSGGIDRPGVVVDGELVGRPSPTDRAATSRASTTADVVRDVVDDDVGAGLRLERRGRAPRGAGRRPTARSGGRARSRSRLATLTNTERVTADGAVRTASATIAWFLRSRPTCKTLTGAETVTVGGVASAASVATRICAPAGAARQLRGELERVAEVAACRCRSKVVDRLPDAPEVGRLVDHDPCRPVRGDDADLAAGGQVPEGVDGRVAGRGQPVRRDVRGAHAGRGVDHEDDVPGEPGRPLQERSRREQHQRERPAAAGAAGAGSAGAAATARWPRRRSAAGSTAAWTGRPPRRAAA